MKTKENEVYLHISNSGVKFKVIDEGWGPTIVVSSSAFGNANTEIRVHTTPQCLAALGEMFNNMSQKQYSEEYCHAAK